MSTSSAVIQDIMALRNAKSVSMAYFYCDSRDKDKQSYRSLLLSFLFQLYGQSQPFFKALSTLFLEHERGTEIPSDAIVLQCLKEVLSRPAQDPVYLIVDALDEFPKNSGMPSPREQVLELIKDLVDMSSPNLHICVTSLPEIDIKTSLEPLTSLRISLHEQSEQTGDIINYVNSVVLSDANMRTWSVKDKRLVIDTLSEGADGMYECPILCSAYVLIL